MVYINISWFLRNENLKKLPNELAKLKRLQTLKEPENLKEPEDVAEVIQQKKAWKTKRILSLMHHHLYFSEPYRGMKMIVVGPAVRKLLLPL